MHESLSAVATWPVIARAQQSAMPVIGYLGNGTLETDRSLTDIRRGLSEAGYVEGRNLAIEYRWAEHRLDRMPALAASFGSTATGDIQSLAMPITCRAPAGRRR